MDRGSEHGKRARGAPRSGAVPGLLLLAVMLAAGCAARGPVGTLRYANQDIVWRVDDRRDVPRKPDERELARILYDLDTLVVATLVRLLDVPDPVRASNVNALDEVPDSTWFTNRIGLRDLSVERVRRGPGSTDPADRPEAHRPWTITSSKIGGTSVGFLIKDARGTRYLLKFDEKGIPEMETGAHVIVQRLLWACGYNVPEDEVVYFEREDLLLAPDAKIRDSFGNTRKMTMAALEERLARINREPGKPIRGLISKFLPGVPIGGAPIQGVREDDPNDRVPHEDRRDLRGFYSIAAWLGHTDHKEGNTLDIWAEDPENPGHHHVVHYLIDFGKALGVMAYIGPQLASGFTHSTDFRDMVHSLLGLGLRRRPWEYLTRPEPEAVGIVDSERYDPSSFKTHLPYYPFHDRDRFDEFWGAKILVRFTPEMIRAVVEEARFSDPRATEYLTRVLVERQRETARWAFEKVNPLDRFTVEPGGTGLASGAGSAASRLCFDDLSLRYGLTEIPAASTRYEVAPHDHEGRPFGPVISRPGSGDGRVCVDDIRPGPSHQGYVIMRIVTYRGARGYPAVLVHLAAHPVTGRLRIIGLRRT